MARRGADLLDQKLRILRAERQRFALLESRTRQAWEVASREADAWLLRTVLLGGQRTVRLAQPRTSAGVQIAWAYSMGVRYPSDARCDLPAPEPAGPPAGNAALVAAATTFNRALEAAVQHAVAEAAVRAVQTEETATRRRLRAIEHRWVPLLEKELAKAELGIEEREQAEAVRLRWALHRRPSGDGTREETP